MLSNHSNQDCRIRRIVRRTVRMAVCLMMAVVLLIPVAFQSDVFAASSSSPKYTTARKQYMAGLDVRFNEDVISNKRLSSGPSKLNVTGQWISVRLRWTPVSNTSAIDGYYILRRDRDYDIWRHVATVTRKATAYTDATSRTANRCYRYSVLAYKKVDGKIMVSGPAGWAGALTTRSREKNVYEAKVSNPANVVSVSKGSCAQIYLTFPDNAYSKYIRWWSGNETIAKVNNKGLITGVTPGTTNIYYKTHTGTINSFTTYITRPGTAQAMITTFKAWEGYSRLNGKQHGIIDIYNSVTPWPAGYRMRYSDAWCDATVTAAAIKTGNVGRIGRECGVPRHIKIFQKLGIWEEDGTIRPRPGDIIVFSWNKWSQPNNASASHIGIVEKVVGNTIYTIEGNRGIGVVGTRQIPVGWGCIRGYARPKYSK